MRLARLERAALLSGKALVNVTLRSTASMLRAHTLRICGKRRHLYRSRAACSQLSTRGLDGSGSSAGAFFLARLYLARSQKPYRGADSLERCCVGLRQDGARWGARLVHGKRQPQGDELGELFFRVLGGEG